MNPRVRSGALSAFIVLNCASFLELNTPSSLAASAQGRRQELSWPRLLLRKYSGATGAFVMVNFFHAHPVEEGWFYARAHYEDGTFQDLPMPGQNEGFRKDLFDHKDIKARFHLRASGQMRLYARHLCGRTPGGDAALPRLVRLEYRAQRIPSPEEWRGASMRPESRPRNEVEAECPRSR